MSKITIVTSSRDQETIDRYKKHVLSTSGFAPSMIQFLFYENKNEFSLTELYNKAIKESENDIIVFMHDDLVIQTDNWCSKLLKHFDRNSEYGIIGIAGCNYLEDGRWWTIQEAMHGVVKHTDGQKKWINNYSPSQGNKIKRMVVLDGLFFAIDRSKIKHQFDEDFKGFHMYDLSFCFPNYIDGVKIGLVTDILVLHKSIGQTNPAWEVNKGLFEEKYKSNLPAGV